MYRGMQRYMRAHDYRYPAGYEMSPFGRRLRRTYLPLCWQMTTSDDVGFLLQCCGSVAQYAVMNEGS